MRNKGGPPEVIVHPGLDDAGAVAQAALDLCGVEVDLHPCTGLGTSDLEALLQQHGVDAAQVVVPADHLLLDPTRHLPAIVPTATSFVLVLGLCSRGARCRVLDPLRGVLWLGHDRLLGQLRTVAVEVPTEAWRTWAGSDDALVPIRRRMERLGVDPERLERVLDAPGWRDLARLDGALRWADRTQRDVAACLDPNAPVPWDHLAAVPSVDSDDTLLLRGVAAIQWTHRDGVGPRDRRSQIAERLRRSIGERVRWVEDRSDDVVAQGFLSWLTWCHRRDANSLHRIERRLGLTATTVPDLPVTDRPETGSESVCVLPPPGSESVCVLPPPERQMLVAGSESVCVLPPPERQMLVAGSVRDNLLAARTPPWPASDHRDAESVARALDLDGLARRWPGGLDHWLDHRLDPLLDDGARGRLEPSERRRICLARTLLSDAGRVVVEDSFDDLPPALAARCRRVAALERPESFQGSEVRNR